MKSVDTYDTDMNMQKELILALFHAMPSLLVKSISADRIISLRASN
jgi:hypothetical protein